MRKHWKTAAAVFAAIAVVFAVVGCASPENGGEQQPESEAQKGPITVGSKIDTEGELLATMIQQVLESDGFIVEDKSQTGPTAVARRALLTGEIDIYP
jgi:glycine betaine/choline ABC-type transport system substrate-binding protein